MSKISLWGILRGYLNTLHSGSNKQILIGDVAAQIFLPLGCSCLIFFNAFGSKDAVSNMLQGILTWVSIASALLCGVAIMIFQLRLQLASQKNPEPTENETRLIDEIFSDTLWAVVAGFIAAFLIIINSMLITLHQTLADICMSLSIGFAFNLVLVTCMVLKRMDVAYKIISKIWSK